MTYDAKGNVYFPMGDKVHHRLLLRAGDVAVLMPPDAHAACLMAEGEEGELVRKIVVKVRDAHLLEGPEAAHFQADGDEPDSAVTAHAPVAETLNQNLGGGR